MVNIRIRKDQAGDASGHDDGTGKPWSFDWPNDGAVVAVPYAVAVELLQNPAWGFSEAGEDDNEPAKDDQGEDGKDDDKTVEEPTPAGEEFSESPAPRKTAAAKPAKKAAAAPAASPAKE
jgi:hypothetical protein